MIDRRIWDRMDKMTMNRPLGYIHTHFIGQFYVWSHLIEIALINSVLFITDAYWWKYYVFDVLFYAVSNIRYNFVVKQPLQKTKWIKDSISSFCDISLSVHVYAYVTSRSTPALQSTRTKFLTSYVLYTHSMNFAPVEYTMINAASQSKKAVCAF